MDTMWTWKDPRIVRCWLKCTTLLWKAILMRKRSIVFSILEILIPVIFAIQIRLIFEPLALNIQNIDHRSGQEILSNIPKETNYRYAPKSQFFDALMDQASTIIHRPILPAIDEEELVTAFYSKNKSQTPGHVVWVIFQENISKSTSRPEVLNYKIRTKMAGGFDHETDIYMSGGFTAMQMAVESSFIKMWNPKNSYFTGENVTIGQFPFYRIHFPMLPSTVRPNISLIYYLTIVGFLLNPMTTLHKAIHDKTTGFKALMRMLRFHPGLMYLGWFDYLIITAIPAATISTWILSPIYSNSGAIVLGIFFMMYITVSTIFMLAIGTFFMHSMKAVLACSIFWIFLAHATIVLDESIIDSGLLIKTASLFLPHSGLLYGLAALTSRSEVDEFRVEKSLVTDLGYRTSEIIDDKNKVTIGLVLLFWIIHIIAWYQIGVYLENIFPGKCGTPKSWYYPCKAKSKLSDIFVTFRGSTNWSAVERAPKFVQAKVRVRRVTMKYGIAERLEVLRDMSIDFFPNEFSVILAHNGAGKSSLLKIMTGMYKASHGKVYIEGRDYSDDEWSEYQKKSSISYCPQENILVNYLTTFEHVHLFGMMKEISFKEAKEQALILLKELGLENEKNYMIENLTFSGKRRLCLAMALIGESEVLILDEPAYGLDPQHRKRVWEVLLTLKGKKTIVMATNSMEAADTLADKIAIIANGRIECCGSKFFLNRRYGIGYDLKIIMKSDCNIDILQNSIQEYFPHQITFRGTVGMIVQFNIPKSSRFPKLLSFLESNKEDLKIKCFSLSPPSIEGQFIRIGLSSNFKERGVSFPMNQYELIVQQRRRELIKSGKKWTRLSNATLYQQQLAAMLYKKFLHVASSWKLYLFSIIFSIMTLIFAMMVSEFAKHPHFNSLEINLNVTRYTSRNFLMLYHYSSLDSDATKLFQSLKSITQSYGNNNFHVTDNITATEVMIHPNLHSIHLRDRYFMSMDILPQNQVKIMHSPITIDSSPIALNLFHNSLLRYSTNNDNLRINLKSQPLIDPHDWQHRIVHQKSVKNWENAVIIITLFLILPTIELGIIEARSLTKQLQINTRGVTPLMYWMPIYLIDLMIYVVSLIIISSTIFALYQHRSTTLYISSAIMAQAFLILFAYGTAAIHLGYCIQIFIRQRGSVYLIVLAINFFAILAMNSTIMFPVFLRWLSKPLRILMEVILHGIPAYALACAMGNYIGINLYNSQCMAENNCGNEFGIEDPCCQNCGDRLCYVPLDALLDSQSGSMFVHSVISDVVIMSLQALSFQFILFVSESKALKKSKIVEILETDDELSEDVGKIEQEEASEKEEEEGIFEEIFINNSVEDNEENIASPEIAMSVENLSQNYGRKKIIDEMNFKIYRGQCFGLLGMNGAGKSTVVRVLTGQVPINSGRVIVNNVDMSSHPNEFLGMIGYCPQNNGLMEFMTGRQNLRFFAAIRGVPRKFIEEEIDKWLDVFDLLEFENINIKNCAWGISRKVCLLQSIIGNPLVIILDEPALGMDVITRNALVETLYQVKEMGSTLFLTTHSTEEAEALCDYLGIFVDGKMMKSGTSQEVKRTFGDKMSMKIILNQEVGDESVEAIKMSVERVFPCAELIDRHLNWLNYELDDRISYNEIYEALEKLKREHSNIIDYFVNQQSLGQIFHQLVNVENFVKAEESFLQRIFTELMKIFLRKES